jgi:UDP-arabinose 4-epimerase
MGYPVLVTGGAGYIGSHACKQLHRAGYRVVAYDNLSRGHESAVKWGPLERGAIEDTARVVEAIRRHGIRAVVHFAAYAYVGESVLRPDLYYSNNVGGTLSLLRAMKETAVSRIVFSSTCATYGTPDRVPITESQPQRPINPYGASKWMIERILEDYAAAFEIDSVSLRYFNAAGADPEGEIGEGHEPETHLIPLALKAAADPSSPLTVFGTDYPTPDGTCVRDYIHVQDLATAHVRALQRLESGALRGAHRLNLGTGNGFSVKQVISSVEKVTRKKVHVLFGPRRPGDPAELVADPSRARQLLEWSAEFRDIDSMIRTAWDWTSREGAV